MKYNLMNHLYLLGKKYGIVACATIFNLFLIGSLFTFHVTDASWFYHTNQIQQTHNIFGFVGSHVAAWIIYFFGSAAWLFPCVIAYITIFYFLIFVSKKATVMTEWDRLVGIILGFITATVFCQVYHCIPYDFTYSGGVVGNYFTKMLSAYFDAVSQKIIVWGLLLSSVILILRCSYIPIFRSIYKIYNYVFDSKKLPARILFACASVIISVISFLKKIIYKTYELLSGAILYKIDRSIVEFEYEKNIDQDIDQIVQDLFWDEYIGKQKIELAQKSENFDQELESIMIEKNLEFQRQLDFSALDHPIKELPVKEKVVEAVPVEDLMQISAPRKKLEYKLPFLQAKKIEQKAIQAKQDALAVQAKLLEEKLEQFDIKGSVVAMHAGPVVILFEYQPDIKVKVSRILALEDDLAMALKALSIRIIAPIPGRSVVGFEVANRDRQDVLFSTILDSPEFKKHTGFLPMIFGQDTLGNNVVADLAKMPHLLIAGSTGSGKSVALNALLVSLLCSLRPDQLKLIIIDPKRLEFAAYDGIAHLLFPIVTDTKKAIPILKWVVQTMEERYKIMAKHGVRNLLDYQAAAKLDKDIEPMPLIVVIIDELADLMMTAGKAVEDSIARLAQMARAAGIHMIIATQRPSVDVITGMIKVNFPNRVAFKVTSKIDSRTILDTSGAEKLLGRGDMLFLDASKSHLVRVHGAYVSDVEIHGVVEQIKSQQVVQYLDIFEHLGNNNDEELLDADDELYQEVITLLKDLDEVSISMLQRRFRIGYNRSARIISLLESKGLIMSTEGGKTRRVVR